VRTIAQRLKLVLRNLSGLTAGNRPSQDHVTDNLNQWHTVSEVLGGLFCYPTAGVTPSITGKKAKTRATGRLRLPSWPLAPAVAPEGPRGTRSCQCDEACPLEVGQAASRQPTTTHPRLATLVQPGRALHCSSQVTHWHCWQPEGSILQVGVHIGQLQVALPVALAVPSQHCCQ